MQSQANKCPGSTQHTIALDPGPAPMLSACQNNPSSVRVVIGQHHHFPTTTDTTQPPFGWIQTPRSGTTIRLNTNTKKTLFGRLQIVLKSATPQPINRGARIARIVVVGGGGTCISVKSSTYVPMCVHPIPVEMHGGTVRTPWPAFYAQKSRWQRDLAAKELASRTVWQLMGHPGSIATFIHLTPSIPINRIHRIHRIATHKCTTRSVTNTTTKLFGWTQIPLPSYSVGYKHHASRPAINWANRWIGVSG